MTWNDGYAYESHIERAHEGVLAFLSANYIHSTRQTWAVRLAAGELRLNGRILTADQPLRAGDVLVWHRPPWQEETVRLNFGVLYEDTDVLAVSKPAGLPTVPGGGFLKHTLLSQVREQWPGATPLHRLGRGTSGIVLFALNAGAAGKLLADWRAHRVQKVYLALACGNAQQDIYDIRTPIGPVPHAKLGTVYASSPAGKAAHSVARTLKRQENTTAFEVQIFTGRPHQIRIHLASIGYPLVGDPLYAPGGLPVPDALPGDLGYTLHAWHLTFTHPRSGETLMLKAAPPPVLRQ